MGEVRRTHWVLLVTATVATWVPIAWLYALVAEPAPHRLTEAEFVPVARAVPPQDDAPWERVRLPDDWRRRRPRVREGWYRFRVAPPADAAARALYLPNVVFNVAAWLDGAPVGNGGPFTDPLARNANRPLLFALPAPAAPARAETLHLRVAAEDVDAAFLPVPSVGPTAVLAPFRDRAELVRRTLVWMLVVLRLVVGAFTGAIWLLWPRGAYYGWFALCAGAWVAAEGNVLVVEPPFASRTWDALVAAAIGWWGILGVRLVLSFIGVARPRAERLLTALGVAGTVALFLLAASGSAFFAPLGVNLWLVLVFAASCYLFRGVVPLLLRHPDAIELNVVFVVATSVIGAVLFDLLVQVGMMPRGGLTVPPYTSLVAVVGMGWVLVRRFVGALAQSEALVGSLEERVGAEHAALKARSRRIREVEHARVLAEERERVLRDTDEGVGAQLVSALALLDDPAVPPADLQRAVRAALDDLRLVIDSLDPLDGDLLPALGMLRTRLRPRLEAAGVHVDWRVTDLPPLPDLGPHRVLQILRILQSAFADVLARGGGCRVTVRTGTELADDGRRGAVVEVTDDGAPGGAPADLARMRARAADIGATLGVESARGSSAVRLWIPLVAAARTGGAGAGHPASTGSAPVGGIG